MEDIFIQRTCPLGQIPSWAIDTEGLPPTFRGPKVIWVARGLCLLRAAPPPFALMCQATTTIFSVCQAWERLGNPSWGERGKLGDRTALSFRYSLFLDAF